jgi:hypothetical protein
MRTWAGRRRLWQLLGVVVAIAASVSLGMPHVGATTFWASGETVVYNNLQLSNLGLEGWPDGEMGVETNGSAYTFYSARGGGQDVVRTVGTLAAPGSAGVSYPLISGVPGDVSYASGGPTYTDPVSGMKLLFVHLERHRANSVRYYTTIGLAKSTDDGVNWTFLGEVFSPNSPFEECTGADSDAGSGTYAIHNDGGTDYFYMYVHDRPLGNCSHTNPTSLSALRAPVADVIAAATNGNVSGWSKYYNGSWGLLGTGLGGPSSDLWPDPLPWSEFGSVSWNTYLNKFVLVIARRHTGGLLGDRWWLELTESADGLTWSMPVAAAINSLPGQWAYPTIIGLGSNPRETGQSFHVFYVSSTFMGPEIWWNASLVHRSITFA